MKPKYWLAVDGPSVNSKAAVKVFIYDDLKDCQNHLEKIMKLNPVWYEIWKVDNNFPYKVDMERKV